MKAIFAIATLAVSQITAADLVCREGADTVRLTDKPCVNTEVLEKLPEYIKPMMLQATAILNGKTYAPCWVVYKQGHMYLAYPDGDQGLLPGSIFKDEPGI